MPECTVCGDTNFERVEGFFYCVSCQTQSQHAREEEVEVDWRNENEDEEAPVERPALATVQKMKKASRDLGRPWVCHEAWQCVIKAQVKALISLGADKRLDDVVFRMWVLYLNRYKIAFQDPAVLGNLPQATLQAAPLRMKKGVLVKARMRDKYVGTLAQPNLHDRLRAYLVKQGTLNREKFNVDEDDEVDEDFYDGDNPFESEEINFLEKLSRVENQSSRKKKKLYQELDVKNIPIEETDNFYLSCTLGFCMLGLKYTNPLVMPGDLVRWAKLGKVPLQSAIKSLPDDMKLIGNDRQMFSWARVPSTDELREQCWRLSTSLGILDFAPVDIKLLADRYIEELRLPGELHALVRHLIESNPIDTHMTQADSRQFNSGFEVSRIAMTYVVIMLKLLFCLNDDIEHTLSDYARNMNAIIESGTQLFVWDDWVSSIQHHLHTSAINGLLKEPRDLNRVKDLPAFMETFNTILGERSIIGQKTLYNKQEVRDVLKRPFQLLANRFNRDEPAETSTLDFDLDCPAQETPDARLDFCQTSVKFILENDEFFRSIENRQNPGISTATIEQVLSEDRSDCGSIILDRAAEDDEDLSEDLPSSLPSGQRDAPESRAKSAIQDMIQTNAETEIITNDQEFQRLREICVHRNKYHYSRKNEGFYLSYQWLLDVCSEHIGEPAEALNQTVTSFELKLIIPDSQLDRASKYRKKNVTGKWKFSS